MPMTGRAGEDVMRGGAVDAGAVMLSALSVDLRVGC